MKLSNIILLNSVLFFPTAFIQTSEKTKQRMLQSQAVKLHNEQLEQNSKKVNNALKKVNNALETTFNQFNQQHINNVTKCLVERGLDTNKYGEFMKTLATVATKKNRDEFDQSLGNLDSQLLTIMNNSTNALLSLIQPTDQAESKKNNLIVQDQEPKLSPKKEAKMITALLANDQKHREQEIERANQEKAAKVAFANRARQKEEEHKNKEKRKELTKRLTSELATEPNNRQSICDLAKKDLQKISNSFLIELKIAERNVEIAQRNAAIFRVFEESEESDRRSIMELYENDLCKVFDEYKKDSYDFFKLLYLGLVPLGKLNL